MEEMPCAGTLTESCQDATFISDSQLPLQRWYFQADFDGVLANDPTGDGPFFDGGPSSVNQRIFLNMLPGNVDKHHSTPYITLQQVMNCSLIIT